MEFSDSDEEIIDLNDEKNKEKEEKKEKSKSKNSLKNINWVKQSIESISQIVKSENEENENSEYNIENRNNGILDNINDCDNDNDNDNDEDNQDDSINEKNDVNYNKNNKYNDFTEKTEETQPDSNAIKKKNIKKNINNYTFIWDEGGNNVKLIGSFSNWKQQYEMEKDEKDNIYKFSLPLNNEKYQYKFIVDGVWKCSKKQSTIDDGKGNINNILDLTNIKPKEEIKKKSISKKNSKNFSKKKIKEKKKKEKKNSDLKKEKKEQKKANNNNEYGNDYPDYMKLTEPNNSNNIGKAFNINNESKQKKIGNPKYYKFEAINSYSSNKSYLNLINYRHTRLNHILFQKKIKNDILYIKIGMSNRYREKATTFIYYNCKNNN